MVRKNPLTERGPTPPNGRPEPQRKGRAVPSNLFELRPIAEYIELWDTVFASTEKQISLLRLYVQLQMPGVSLDQLEQLKVEIEQAIQEAQDA